jgi:hypothetical protein
VLRGFRPRTHSLSYTRPHTFSHTHSSSLCRYAGILSAVGIHLANIVQEAQEPSAATLTDSSGVLADVMQALMGRLDALEEGVRAKLTKQVGGGGA